MVDQIINRKLRDELLAGEFRYGPGIENTCRRASVGVYFDQVAQPSGVQNPGARPKRVASGSQSLKPEVQMTHWHQPWGMVMSPKEFRVCNVKIHAVQVDDAMAVVRRWIEGERAFHYVASTNVHNVAIALESPEYYEVMERADLSLPDGVPFLWYGRLKGFPLSRRCGIEELMEALFEMSNRGDSHSHYFYGNTPEVLAKLKNQLLARYPHLKIAGMFAPPFRQLSGQEDVEDVKLINASGADFLWVSLGCPKQEKWLYDHRDRLNVVLGGGAGAVFNFISGQTFRAPGWVRYMGLEWLVRLLVEPKRLYRRYLITYPKFVVRFVRYSLGLRAVR